MTHLESSASGGISRAPKNPIAIRVTALTGLPNQFQAEP